MREGAVRKTDIRRRSIGAGLTALVVLIATSLGTLGPMLGAGASPRVLRPTVSSGSPTVPPSATVTYDEQAYVDNAAAGDWGANITLQLSPVPGESYYTLTGITGTLYGSVPGSTPPTPCSFPVTPAVAAQINSPFGIVGNSLTFYGADPAASMLIFFHGVYDGPDIGCESTWSVISAPSTGGSPTATTVLTMQFDPEPPPAMTSDAGTATVTWGSSVCGTLVPTSSALSGDVQPFDFLPGVHLFDWKSSFSACSSSGLPDVSSATQTGTVDDGSAILPLLLKHLDVVGISFFYDNTHQHAQPAQSGNGVVFSGGEFDLEFNFIKFAAALWTSVIGKVTESIQKELAVDLVALIRKLKSGPKLIKEVKSFDKAFTSNMKKRVAGLAKQLTWVPKKIRDWIVSVSSQILDNIVTKFEADLVKDSVIAQIVSYANKGESVANFIGDLYDTVIRGVADISYAWWSPVVTVTAGANGSPATVVDNGPHPSFVTISPN